MSKSGQSEPNPPINTTEAVVIPLDGEEANDTIVVGSRKNDAKKPTTQKKLTSACGVTLKGKKKDGKWAAVCNHCKKSLSGESSSGTSHLKNHLARCRKRTHQDIQQQLLQNGERKKDGTIVLENFRFDQDKSRLALARMFILHEYPFNMVIHVGFRLFVRSLQPRFTFQSRQTLTSDIMKVYESEKSKMYAKLDAFHGRISITSDLWTSNQNKGYISLTAHYIDSNWTLHKKILNFLKVGVPHNSEKLGDTMLACLMEWNIDGKIFTMTLDNCSVNNKMAAKVIERLNENHSLLFNGRYIHVRCAAHVLNLIVKQGLQAIAPILKNIRKSVKYVTGSPKKEKAFKFAVKQTHISSEKRLFLDCETRWNSTYLMPEVAIIYKEAFSRLQARDRKYKHVPSDRDWEKACEVASCLKTFYDATLTFSGVRCPTSNLYFEEVCEIHINLMEWCQRGGFVGSMAEKMKLKFDEYWSECHLLLAVAVFLDPRSKLMMVECYYRNIYGDEGSSKTKLVRDEFERVYHEYAINSPSDKLDSRNWEVGSTSNVEGPENKKQKRFDKFLSEVSNEQTTKSEVDYYLDEAVIPRTSTGFDVLGWWKVHEGKYPILAIMARDILAIPVSTVASESAFSTGSRVISKYRSRLKSVVVQGLICSQSWMKDEFANYEACEDEDDSGVSEDESP